MPVPNITLEDFDGDETLCTSIAGWDVNIEKRVSGKFLVSIFYCYEENSDALVSLSDFITDDIDDVNESISNAIDDCELTAKEAALLATRLKQSAISVEDLLVKANQNKEH